MTIFKGVHCEVSNTKSIKTYFGKVLIIAPVILALVLSIESSGWQISLVQKLIISSVAAFVMLLGFKFYK